MVLSPSLGVYLALPMLATTFPIPDKSILVHEVSG